MNPITVPMIVKASHPVLTFVLLTLVAAAFCAVLYCLLRHQHHARKAKKHGDSPHTGRHGNH